MASYVLIWKLTSAARPLHQRPLTATGRDLRKRGVHMRSHISTPATRSLRDTASVTHDRRSFDPRPPYQVRPLDLLLADVAIRVQLSRTDYDKAGHRYQRVSHWVERDGSRLAGLIRLFYPQGSMAIGATIAARGTDEFDIGRGGAIDARRRRAAEYAAGHAL